MNQLSQPITSSSDYYFSNNYVSLIATVILFQPGYLSLNQKWYLSSKYVKNASKIRHLSLLSKKQHQKDVVYHYFYQKWIVYHSFNWKFIRYHPLNLQKISMKKKYSNWNESLKGWQATFINHSPSNLIQLYIWCKDQINSIVSI